MNAVQVCDRYKPDWFHKHDYIIYEDDKLSVMDNIEFEELYDRNVYE